MNDVVKYDCEKIGKYFRGLITEKFKTQAAFCKKYCETDTGIHIDTLKNNVSEICNGNKQIPSEYLMGFSKLLGVSCENLLSAGMISVPHSFRDTNFSVAGSKDASKWEAYIHNEAQPILQADEYGKTVIDYALEFENYEFLKFLIIQKYIWFSEEKKINAHRTQRIEQYDMYSVGCSIKPRYTICHIEEVPDNRRILRWEGEDFFYQELYERKNLRQEILALGLSGIVILSLPDSIRGLR